MYVQVRLEGGDKRLRGHSHAEIRFIEKIGASGVHWHKQEEQPI